MGETDDGECTHVVDAGDLRARLEAGNISDTRPGDPDKVVAAMIASVDVEPAPLRLATGSDAFGNIQTILKRRLASIEAQEDLARSTDVEGEDVVSLL